MNPLHNTNVTPYAILHSTQRCIMTIANGRPAATAAAVVTSGVLARDWTTELLGGCRAVRGSAARLYCDHGEHELFSRDVPPTDGAGHGPKWANARKGRKMKHPNQHVTRTLANAAKPLRMLSRQKLRQGAQKYIVTGYTECIHFTDGSRSSHGTGSTYLTLDTVENRSQKKLSIFTAELTAILTCLDGIMQTRGERFAVFTDSLQLLRNSASNTPLMFSILEKIGEARHRDKTRWYNGFPVTLESGATGQRINLQR